MKITIPHWLWMLVLSCNVIAIGIHLFRTGAGWTLWINLIGCVYFGVLAERRRRDGRIP